MTRYRSLLALLVTLVLALSACAGAQVPSRDDVSAQSGTPMPSEATQTDHVRVVVTIEFGAEQLVDQTLLLEPEMTALDALRRVADVETAYGGAFVEAIEGVGADGEQGDAGRGDWFYFMNGFLAKESAGQYVLRAGEVEHWDYRGWAFRSMVSATLQSFPTALAMGYNGTISPTIVAYDEAFVREAEGTATFLDTAGVLDVRVLPLRAVLDTDRENSNLVVLGSASASFVQELNLQWERVGLFAQFDGPTLRVFTSSGENSAEYGDGVGLIEAMQNPWNPSGMGACENIVLLVTGTDDEGVSAAAEAVISSRGEAANWPSAIVVDGVLMQVPVRDSAD